MTEQIKPHHIEALQFLRSDPGHEIGVIQTEGQLAAAYVFSELMAWGYVTGTLKPGAGGVRLTAKGEFEIAQKGTQQ